MTFDARFRSFLLPLAASATLTACGDARSSGGARPVVEHDTIGDTVVVRTVSGSAWGSDRILAPQVSIGKLEGEPEYLFGRVSAVAVAPDGTIYVLDRQAAEVRSFGPDGTYRVTLGRQGGGPGELRMPDGLAVLSDGRVLVRDPGNGRIQVFAPDGSPLAAWPVVRAGYSTSAPMGPDVHDNVYVPVWPTQGDPAEWKMALVRIAPDGTPGDTLPLPDAGFDQPMVEVHQTENGRVVGVARYQIGLAPAELWALHPSGTFVHAVSTDYRIDLLRTDQPVLRIERAYEPVPVRPEEKAQLVDGITESARRMQPGWHWNGPPIPDRKPPFKSIMAGRDGRLWVTVSLPGQEMENPSYDPARPGSKPTLWGEPTAWDVFEPDGTYLGRVRAPEDLRAFPMPVFDGDRVWAVTSDSLGVQRVVRYEAVPNVAAGGGD